MSTHESHAHWTDVSEHKGFHPHVMPLKVYFAVFAALMFLTVATVGLYRLDPGHLAHSLGISENLVHPINMILSMIIATTKATLVALIFMHLFFDNKFYLLLFLGSLLFLAVFICVTMFDTMRRGDIYEYRADGPNVQIEGLEPRSAHGAGHGDDAAHGAESAHGEEAGAAAVEHDTAAPAGDAETPAEEAAADDHSDHGH